MAEVIANKLDFNKYGVAGIYILGSTKNATAGPGSDIDILIHHVGNISQKKELETWFEGWSICLAEINYAITGYNAPDKLIDLHIVNDEDIKNKTSFAIKINAVSDRARPLKTINK